MSSFRRSALISRFASGQASRPRSVRGLLTRIGFNLHRMMLLVASAALSLFAWMEFRDGIPPRSVVNGVPALVAGLRPGMWYQETKDFSA